MRWAIPQPCMGSSASVLRTSISKVPWTRSVRESGMVVPSVDLKEESTATSSDCQQEQGIARWRSLGEALRLGNGEAAATPPEGMEEHQWFVGGEREAR